MAKPSPSLMCQGTPLALLKAELAARIKTELAARQLTTQEAATLVKTTRPRISRLCNGHLEAISVDALLVMLWRLGHEIRLDIIPKPRPKPKPRPLRLVPLQKLP